MQVNNIKLTQAELFSLIHFKNVAANVFELFLCPCKHKMNVFNTAFWTIILNKKNYTCVNSPPWADEN